MSCLLSMMMMVMAVVIMMMVIQKRKILDWRTLPFQPPTAEVKDAYWLHFDPLDDDV